MVVSHYQYRESGNCAEAIARESLRPSSTKCLTRASSSFLSFDKSSASRPLLLSVCASASSQKQLWRSSSISPQSSRKARRFPLLEETVDNQGYLCSPRAARELAFSILYAGLVSGQKPLRIFRERLKQRSGYFAKELLTRYKHAPDGGDSIFIEDPTSAKKLELEQHEESLLEAAVLSAPPSKVYNESILTLAQGIIQATVDSWPEHEIILTDILPVSWKEPGGSAAAQQCILHMSMAEMAKCGTSPRIAINEAVELAKRFSDQRAARIINGCLGNFTRSEYYREIIGAKKEVNDAK